MKTSLINAQKAEAEDDPPVSNPALIRALIDYAKMPESSDEEPEGATHGYNQLDTSGGRLRNTDTLGGSQLTDPAPESTLGG
jgi:hypothetical protein